MKKTLITILATVLVCCCVVGGTLAWLTDKSETVTNTFTVGDIEIELTETERTYKMVPGNVLPKDPKVTVLANSEACWLFVQVTKSANFDTYLTFETADGWTKLTDDGDNNEYTTVYYREVAATTTDDVSFYFLKAGEKTGTENGCVTVIDTLTAADLEAAETANPTLTFTAYAVQQENIDDEADAWTAAQDAEVNP